MIANRNGIGWRRLRFGNDTVGYRNNSRENDILELQVRIKPAGISRGYFMGIALVVLALVSAPAQSYDLKEETLAGWGDYISSACLRAEPSAKRSSFLRINELPEGRLRVREGETLVWRESDGHPAKVPHGLIHDWAGAVFIPKATMADVLAVARDYEHYPEIYTSAVVKANRLGSEENDDRFSMVIMQKVLFLTAAVKGEYETRYVQVDAKRWYSVSKSIRLQSIENYGQPDVRVLPPDRGPGFVWRLYSFARFEESDGGVYIELEALGLSRDVPMLVRWLVDPVVEHLPRNSLQATLDKTRDAVLAKVSREDLTAKISAR